MDVEEPALQLIASMNGSNLFGAYPCAVLSWSLVVFIVNTEIRVWNFESHAWASWCVDDKYDFVYTASTIALYPE